LLRDVFEAAEEGDFNRFEAGLCDVATDPFLLDGFAALRLRLATRFLDAFDDLVPGLGLGDVLGDFLRDFLDIRLPFVAFAGSIIRVFRGLAAEGESSRWLGKSDGLGVWLQGIRRTACPLVE
jgi:hypothetical protein